MVIVDVYRKLYNSSGLVDHYWYKKIIINFLLLLNKNLILMKYRALYKCTCS